jgi:hypothetical protein
MFSAVKLSKNSDGDLFNIPQNGHWTFDGASDQTYYTNVTQSFSPGANVVTSNLDQYIGNGTYNITLFAGNTPMGMNDGMIEINPSTTWFDANWSVTYNYTPMAVPEPGSLAAIAMGMAGFVSLKLRRR